jgi:hypothetical protein
MHQFYAASPSWKNAHWRSLALTRGHVIRATILPLILLLRAGQATGDSSKVICVSRENGYDGPILEGGFPWKTFNSLPE